jgi:hypothetical protein
VCSSVLPYCEFLCVVVSKKRFETSKGTNLHFGQNFEKEPALIRSKDLCRVDSKGLSREYT